MVPNFSLEATVYYDWFNYGWWTKFSNRLACSCGVIAEKISGLSAMACLQSRKICLLKIVFFQLCLKKVIGPPHFQHGEHQKAVTPNTPFTPKQFVHQTSFTPSKSKQLLQQKPFTPENKLLHYAAMHHLVIGTLVLIYFLLHNL